MQPPQRAFWPVFVLRTAAALASLWLIGLAPHAVSQEPPKRLAAGQDEPKKPGGEPPGLYQFRSKGGHYQVTANVDKALARDVADHLERAHAEYDRRLSGFHARDSRLLALYVFATYEQYVQTLRDRMGVTADNSSGMYFETDRGPSLAVWVEGQSRAALFETLRHEGFHQFAVSRIGRDLPPWANEGLARYFGDATLVGGKFVTGRASAPRLRYLKKLIEDDKQIPLKQLVNLPTAEWGLRVTEGDRQAGLQYDQAWSLVYFLINAERGKYADPFEQYLKLISQGRRADEAFEQAFGANSYASFEKAWKKYILELEPDPVSIAAQRLRFLGVGLAKLYEKGETVESLAQLREKLKTNRFSVRFMEHGSVFTMSAEDDENFEAPQPEKARKPATMELEPARDAKLPPGIVVEGLRPTVRLVWWADEHGKPVDDVVFK